MTLSLIIFIIVGAVAGVVATQSVVTGPRLGVMGNMALGVAGAFVGGFFLGLFGEGFAGWLSTFLAATVGAMVLLAIFTKLTRDRVRR